MQGKLNGQNSSAQRAEELFEQQREKVFLNTDKLFARLMPIQWLAAIVMALIVSPRTWSGQSSQVHIHVWAAIFLGGAITIFPVWMTRAWPGAAATRYVIGVAQMLMSALLIDLTGGRIETHFHVFGSLVILAFYRDWRILIPATLVVYVDHILRGLYFPYSVYGVLNASPWRSLEHAGWVIFEDIFLIIWCLRNVREMRFVADRTAALEESEEDFRQIFEEAPIGIAEVDLKLRFQRVNATLCQMLGYSEEELGQRTTLDITHWEDVDREKEIVELLLNGAPRCTFEKRNLGKNNQLVWVNRTTCLIRDENAKPHHFLTMVKDVSERKQREKELEENKKRLEATLQANQLIMDNSLDVICTSNEEGQLVTVSAACQQLWGYAPTELVGTRYIDMVYPEDRPRTKEASAEVKAGHALKDFENRHVHKDGSLVYMLWSAHWSEADKTMFAVGRDIAARKQAEQELLRHRDEQTRLIVDTAYDAFVAIDSTGRITTWNTQAEATFGWPRNEAIGRTLAETIIPPQHREAHGRELKHFHATGEGPVLNKRLELTALHRDGREFPIELTIWPIKIGETCTFNAFIRDITERKQSEEAVQKAKVEAEEANRAKSEFLSRMSHELRTPLNAILGFGQLLERRNPTPSQRPRIQHIVSAGRHLLGLINEVLDISRIEVGKLPMSIEPVALPDTLKEALGLMRPFAVERGIDLAVPARIGDASYIVADLQRFKQVLLNLLTNAIKYTPPRGSVAIVYNSIDGDRVRIAVSDNGPGIPHEKLSRLFTPFERLGAEQTNVEGTGLGLALSQRLIQAMGGSIGVESTVGQGSTFWVELPRATSPLDQALTQKRITPPQATKSSRARKRTVLYIEDNLSNLTLVEELLDERPNVELLTAMQGQIGLDLARQHSPDLVLLDLHLPDVSGSHVLSQLQAAEATRHIPVVVISADATAGEINRLMVAGARDYLTKPIDVNKFFQILEETTTKPVNRIKQRGLTVEQTI